MTHRGKVTGVVYADETGAMQRQKARIVAVAGNSIESPRLLLNSASTMFPDGLANSSGQVGRNYMRHMTGSVYAVFEKSVHMYRGTTMAGIIRDEAANNPKRGFVGGYEMETLSIGLPFMAAFLNPGAWGRPFTSAMEAYPRMAGMWLVGEDMPQETNRITLDPVAKDKFGMPVASVHFDDHPNDVAMRAHAYKQGAAVYEAVGATVTYPTPPYPATHNLGTNRMSEKPQGRRGQQVRPEPRRQEPVRLRRQPVHQRRGLQSDADHRLAGDPAGGLHRRRDAEEGDLRSDVHRLERSHAPSPSLRATRSNPDPTAMRLDARRRAPRNDGRSIPPRRGWRAAATLKFRHRRRRSWSDRSGRSSAAARRNF